MTWSGAERRVFSIQSSFIQSVCGDAHDLAHLLRDLAPDAAEAFERVLLVDLEGREELRIRSWPNSLDCLRDDLLEPLELLLWEEIAQLLDQHQPLRVPLLNFLVKLADRLHDLVHFRAKLLQIRALRGLHFEINKRPGELKESVRFDNIGKFTRLSRSGGP